MQVHVIDNDITGALRILKRRFQREGVSAILSLHSIPKLSERRKEKARRAEKRKNKKKGRIRTWGRRLI